MTATARRMGIETWTELEENYAEFLKEFAREAYIKCSMYRALTNNDTVYSQLIREERRLYRHGYTIPGEAWQRAWSNRKCLIKSLLTKLKADMQQDEDLI